MRGIVRKVNKKWVFVLAFNEVDEHGSSGHQWQVNPSPLDELPIALEHRTEVVPPVARTEAVELIEPSPIGMIRMLHATMPLTKGSGSVTSFLENLTDHRLVRIHAFTTLGRGVHAAANVMPTSQKLRTRRRTDRADEEPLEDEPHHVASRSICGVSKETCCRSGLESPHP